MLPWRLFGLPTHYPQPRREPVTRQVVRGDNGRMLTSGPTACPPARCRGPESRPGTVAARGGRRPGRAPRGTGTPSASGGCGRFEFRMPGCGRHRPCPRTRAGSPATASGASCPARRFRVHRPSAAGPHPTTRAWSPPFPRERGRRRLAASTRPPRPRTFPRERPAVPPGPPGRRAARPDTGRRPSPGRGRPPTPPPRSFGLRLPDAARRSARPPRPSRRPLRQLTRRRLHLPLRPARRPIPRPRGPTPALAAPGRTPPPAPAAAPTRPPASTAPGRPPSRPRPPTSAARGSPAGAVPPCVAARGSAGRALLVRAARNGRWARFGAGGVIQTPHGVRYAIAAQERHAAAIRRVLLVQRPVAKPRVAPRPEGASGRPIAPAG